MSVVREAGGGRYAIRNSGYRIQNSPLYFELEYLTKVAKVRRASVNVERRPRTAASTCAPTYIHPDDVH